MNPFRLYLISNQKSLRLFRLLQQVIEGEGVEATSYQLLRKKYSTSPPVGGTGYIFHVSTSGELKLASLASSFLKKRGADTLTILSDIRFHSHAPMDALIEPQRVEEETLLKQKIADFINRSLGQEGSYGSQSGKIWVVLRRGVYQSLPLSEIKYIVVKDHYLHIYCDGLELPQVKSSLKGFFKQHLSSRPEFYMLSRSMIINADRIQRIENDVLVIDDHEVPIPRNRKQAVLEFFGLSPASGKENQKDHYSNLLSWK